MLGFGPTKQKKIGLTLGNCSYRDIGQYKNFKVCVIK